MSHFGLQVASAVDALDGETRRREITMFVVSCVSEAYVKTIHNARVAVWHETSWRSRPKHEQILL